MFSYEEAYQKSLEYFGGDELAAKVFIDKYALRDGDNNILEDTPQAMHERIARELARIEAGKYVSSSPMGYGEILGYLEGFRKIIPQGSPMYGIGNKYQYSTLSNCYVVESPLDSYGSILKADEQLVQISKRRGGVGLDVSNIRPAKSRTNNAARTSTGVVPFMTRYSNSIREVGQDGRRGALMLTIDVHHPEVIDFAMSKLDKTKVTGANISIRLTDEFLKAVKENGEYEQRFPVDPKEKRKYSKMVSARDVWRKLIELAHGTAEPGLLFWDTILRESPADCYPEYITISTNPCSELPLSALDSCRLLLLNLFGYVKNPFTNEAYFDFDEFYKDAQIAQRFMDDIVDLELESIQRIIDKIEADPEPDEIKYRELQLWKDIYNTCFNGRRTGTGITALGDAMAAIDIKYGSEESIEFTEKVYKTLKLGCYRASVDMAKELGAFPVWDAELEKSNPFLLRIRDEDPELYREMQQHGRRNIAILTTAPAGSTSIEALSTSGIEPLYLIFFIRYKKVNPSDGGVRVDRTDANGDNWQEFRVYHPKVKMWMEITGETDIEKSPWYGATAEEIDWKNRVRLQAAANRHVDHAISSTLNLPNDVSVEAVAEIYETAWECGCKGITVYRDGCRDGVLVKEAAKVEVVKKTEAPKRPKSLPCDVHHPICGGKRFFVLVGMLGNDPYEVMAGQHSLSHKITKGNIVKQKRGVYRLDSLDDEVVCENVIDYCGDDQEALLRMVSTSLRHGADIGFVVDQLSKIKGMMNSFARCLARVLKTYIKEGAKIAGASCDECGGSNVKMSDGCNICMDCGNSKCR